MMICLLPAPSWAFPAGSETASSASAACGTNVACTHAHADAASSLFYAPACDTLAPAHQ